ncbi:MAG: 4Fe-4S dicluster domain-containing protein [Proteobacteria bacterium]|nr:4Fe-4S dicluster domain-containing protein [Pseudomonadota bacterium]
MEKDVYRKLQEQLDMYSVGFPATKSGVEIKILKKLFSEEDASIFTSLTPMLETPQAISEKIGKPLDWTREKLKDMAGRGLLFSKTGQNETKYGAIAFVHGVFEFQVKRMDRELAELMDEYGQKGFGFSMIKSAASFLRTIPVNQSVDVQHKVASFDDACDILKTKKLIVVTDCICRKQRGLTQEGCGKVMEACFMFGSMAQYYLDHHMGRQINYEDALKIMKDAQEEGLVTQPATSQNPAGMCNCCGDCCGVLKSVNAHPKPAQIVFSNHYASLDISLCTGCEVCVDRCQMHALKMSDDGLASLNPDRCIGCGLCVTTCPSGALSLLPKSEEKQSVPPATSMDQMIEMAKKRGVLPA